MLAEDIAKLMSLVPLEEKNARAEGKDKIEGGAFNGVLDKQTPFMFKGGEGVNAGLGETEWIIAKDRSKYDVIFDKLGPVDGKVTGAGECRNNSSMDAWMGLKCPKVLYTLSKIIFYFSYSENTFCLKALLLYTEESFSI
jgi:hypothetical protein